MAGADFPFETHLLRDAGWCPNNPRLPLLVYRAVHEARDDEALAAWFEDRFAENGWPPAWRYTIYPYAHYHSTAHEVVGIFRGSASVRMGDASGVTILCRAGDVLLIPAGVSHERISSSPDFQGVGAYPQGYEPDEIRDDRGKRPAADKRIAALPVPPLDPVCGEAGPMHARWPISESSPVASSDSGASGKQPTTP
jgi:uncharacterized protein YjlB